jgi:hypothetical protein
VWASVEKEPREVIEQMFQEALRRDPMGTKPLGGPDRREPDTTGLIKKTAKRHAVAPTIVIDIIHVLEYVWKAAFALHSEGCTTTQRWVTERLLEILRGIYALSASRLPVAEKSHTQIYLPKGS